MILIYASSMKVWNAQCFLTVCYCLYLLIVANHYNWSIIGSMAKMIEKTQPTMLFNFSRMNDEEIKGTIVHQFGHALGLGHTLMKPAVWEVIKEYLDLQQLLSFYGSPSLDEFKVQWTGKGRDPESVNYDEKSIMAYRYVFPTVHSWLLGNTCHEMLFR